MGTILFVLDVNSVVGPLLLYVYSIRGDAMLYDIGKAPKHFISVAYVIYPWYRLPYHELYRQVYYVRTKLFFVVVRPSVVPATIL